jgi:DNA-binding PadR family transcriptional regulator
MTIPTQLVLHALLHHPEPAYGLEIRRATGLPSGTVHPILTRLHAAGWLASTWENADPRERGRPRRRYHQLTPAGAAQARRALAAAHTPVSRITAPEIIRMEERSR